MDSWSGSQRQNLAVVIYHTFFPQGVISSDGLEKEERKKKKNIYIYKKNHQENVEINVNKNTDENKIKQ